MNDDVKKRLKRNRGRGKRLEYEVVNILKEHGIKAMRVPNSGNSPEQEMKGDVIFYFDDEKLVGECKEREQLAFYKYFEQSNADVLFMKSPRKQMVVVVPIDKFIKWVRYFKTEVIE